MPKSKVMKGYSVNITEDKFTIPVTSPERDTKEKENEDKIDDAKVSDESITEEQQKDGQEKRTEQTNEHEAEIALQKQQEADILAAHMERLEKLAEQARETERTSQLVGEEIISQAQRTADLIINHTLENAKAELNNALSQGYSDGFETGKSEALSIISPALGKINALTDAIMQIQNQMLEDFKDEMFNIIAEVSKKILHREIEEKDEYLITLFSDAINNIRAENFVTVTVSEAQAEFAVRNIDLFKAKISNIDDFKIIPDKNAERGTMIVETAKTVADASFNVQIAAIDSILERMKENLSVMPRLNNDSDGSHNLDLNSLDYSGNPGGEDTASFPGGLNGLEGLNP